MICLEVFNHAILVGLLESDSLEGQQHSRVQTLDRISRSFDLLGREIGKRVESHVRMIEWLVVFRSSEEVKLALVAMAVLRDPELSNEIPLLCQS